MANSKLQGKNFQVPTELIQQLNLNLKKFSDYKDSKGYKRSLFIVQKGLCSYEQLKRIKNYFDYVNPDLPDFNNVEYMLNGGKMMKKWVDFTLNQARKSVNNTKTARTNAGMTQQFRTYNDPEDNVTPSLSTIKKTPDFIRTSELMEELNKIKKLINL